MEDNQIQPTLHGLSGAYNDLISKFQKLSKNMNYREPKKSSQDRMDDIEEQTRKSKEDINLLNKNIKILQLMIGGAILIIAIALSTWIYDSFWKLDNMKDNFYGTANTLSIKLEQYNTDNQLIKKDIDGINEKIDNKINQKLIDYKLIQPITK